MSNRKIDNRIKKKKINWDGFTLQHAAESMIRITRDKRKQEEEDRLLEAMASADLTVGSLENPKEVRKLANQIEWSSGRVNKTLNRMIQRKIEQERIARSQARARRQAAKNN